MLRAAPLEPVGLLVGWDRGKRSLQWRGTAVPVLPTPPRLPTHPTRGPAAPQPGSHAWCAAELGTGRVKLPKPSQPRRAFAPVTSRSVAVTVMACITLQVHRWGGGVTSPSHCEGWTVGADRAKGCAMSGGRCQHLCCAAQCNSYTCVQTTRCKYVVLCVNTSLSTVNLNWQGG